MSSRIGDTLRTGAARAGLALQDPRELWVPFSTLVGMGVSCSDGGLFF